MTTTARRIECASTAHDHHGAVGSSVAVAMVLELATYTRLLPVNNNAALG